MLGRQFELTLHGWLHDGALNDWKNKIFSVGGFVRDYQIGRDSHDVDLLVTVQGGSEKLALAFKNKFKDEITTPVQMGAIYPIWSFEIRAGEFNGLKIDIADSQKEMFPKNDERQRVASFGTFDEDIQRRDFTVNMLARDLTTDQVIDQSGVGLQDLENGILKAHPLVDARKILSDDPLRIIRAVRFACTHDFKIEQSLFAKMQELAERIKIVSAERILLELTKMTLSSKFHFALELFQELKIIGSVFSEAVEKMLLDMKTKQAVFKILHAAEKKLVYQLAGLFYFLTQSDVEVMATKLKLSHQQKREIITIISQTEKLLLLNPKDFLEVRAFLRSCDINTAELVAFARGVSEDFDKTEFLMTLKKCLMLPVAKKPVLDGHEIADLLKVSGAEIKKAQDLLFKIEDQYVLDYSEALSKEKAQEELLKKMIK